MMKPWIIVLAALLPAAFSATIEYGAPVAPQPADPYQEDGYQSQEQSAPAPTASYEQPSSGGYEAPAGPTPTSGYPTPSAPSYGKAQVKCTPYFETVFTDHCESYTDRVCRSTHQEKCHDVPEKNCRAVVTGRQIRKCFNVTELICKLREDVKYEVVQVGFTVQKCHKVSERVCDTVFDTSFTTKDDFQCLNVMNPMCSTGERTINDKTCTTTTSFDCPQTMGYEEPSYGGSSDPYSSGSSQPTDAYGKSSGYNAPVPKCRRSQNTKCYNTPRTVSVQKCAHNTEKVCEKMTEKVPYAEEKQNCHNEDKKVCELEERTQPKQVKKYVYTKQCRSVPRRVCENADSKQMVPSCVQSMRKQCTQTPVETCEDSPKKHCFKVGRKVRKEKCETVQATYPEQQKSGYPQPQPSEPSYDSPTAEGY